MSYTMLRNPVKKICLDANSFEKAALDFIRDSCQGLRFDMSKKYQKQFIDSCGELTSKYLDTLEADVSHYCKMYDYRNTGANADWGNSKDSIERAIKFLTTR